MTIRKGTPELESSSRRNRARGVPGAHADVSFELAKRLRVPAPRVNNIVLERRGISTDTAVRLSRFFGTTEQFWLNLQGAYEVSRVKAEHGDEIELIEPRVANATR